MPVVTVYYDRMFSMLKGKISKDQLIEKIPYLPAKGANMLRAVNAFTS